MPTLIRAEVMMLAFCQAGRRTGLRIVRRVATVCAQFIFLWHAFRLVRHVASGTLFRLPPTPECRCRPYVGLETSLLAPPLCGPSPFFWVPWCFRVRFRRLLLLRWRPQCVAGAPAWSLVLALPLLLSWHQQFSLSL